MSPCWRRSYLGPNPLADRARARETGHVGDLSRLLICSARPEFDPAQNPDHQAMRDFSVVPAQAIEIDVAT